MMTKAQILVTIAICLAATQLTRFLPFWIFSQGKKTPPVVQYLGRVLPTALFALLLVYSLRHTDLTAGRYGLPEGLALLVTVLVYFWKRQILLPIAAGTAAYMLMLHYVF